LIFKESEQMNNILNYEVVEDCLAVDELLFDAIIFDCDGTLVDTMPKHYEAWTAALNAVGAPYEFTQEDFHGYAGLREQDVVKILNQRYQAEVDGDEVARIKYQEFKKWMPTIKEISFVANLARKFNGVKQMAVASGSELPVVLGCLEGSGLKSMFEVIVTPKDVKRGKPDPEMFLLAAERLRVMPKRCLVIEDGMAGVKGAVAAGMQVIYIGA
jgi:HAD superfamily hydrolase (TIGR01509 family)